MKKLLLFIMFFPPCFSQVVSPTYAPTRSDSSQIIIKIGEIENYINNKESYLYNNPPLFIDDAYFKSIDNLDNNSLNKIDELQNVSIQINEISFNEATAKVDCEIFLYTDSGISKTYTENILLKKNKRWTIINLGYLENIFKTKYQYIKKEISDNPLIENQTILLSPSSFIKKHAIQNPQTYQLDITLTQSQLQKQLFGKSQGIDNTYFSDGTKETAFYLDQSWKRVLFTQSSSTQLKILSYGETVGEYHFQTPRSIDVNEWGELYIADSESKVVNKLYYSWITNTITATSNVNFLQGLLKPVDVDYYQGSTLWNRNDDLIAVADESDNSILLYNSLGTFQCKLTGYYENGVKLIKKPKRVALFGYEYPYRLAFIDGGTNRLIVVRLPENFNNWTGWLNTTSAPVLFANPSDLTDIGIDGCYNILVPDRSKNMIHKFNKNGQYSCSYQGSSNFTLPYYISNVPDNCPNSEMVWVDITLSSIWDNNSGIRRYLPGADLKSIQHAEFINYYRLRFTPTDDIHYKADIIRTQDNVIIKSYEGYASNSVEKDLILDFSELPTNNANYKWKFSFEPYFNIQYGVYGVSLQVREFTFYYSLLPPIIASITQNPVPIYKGTNGYVYCNLAQGNGNLTYNWFSYDQPSYVSIVPEGYRCKIIYHATESIPPIDAPTWNFGCTVTNEDVSGWSDTKTFVPSLNPLLYGCPTLAFDNRGTLTSENPLLITSMSNPGKDVTDYYLINEPLTANNNKINLTIHEPQTEHTWFDNVSLLETQANPGEKIVVNDEGQVINYKDVLPARILLNSETDITENLLYSDSLLVNL
ncbi:MAG: hypothetical protein IT276_00745, partial [Ignavibacteriaceae bacterium]|nr:hypothetical protein [Ignavibacteriaceae bacterium]